MAESGAQVVGLREFRRDLAALDKRWPKELRAVHKKIGDMGASGARGIAVGMGGLQAKNAGAIGPSASATEARISIRAGSRFPSANAAFWGATRKTGWYAASQFRGSPRRQFRPWVGNSWEVASFTGGPYAINRALFFDLDNILNTYMRMLDDLYRRAFPD